MAWVYLVFGFFGSILFPHFPDRSGPTLFLFIIAQNPESGQGLSEKFIIYSSFSWQGQPQTILETTSQLFVCLFQKPLCVYQSPLVGGMTDFSGLVKGGHLEGNDFSGYAGDLRLCPNLQPYGGGGGMG